MAGMCMLSRCAPRWSGGALVRAAVWLLLTLLVPAGCASLALPTPDQSALAALPTATPTRPTPQGALAFGPRPSDTPSPTASPTATFTPSPTSTPSPTATPTPTRTPTPGPLVRALGIDDSRIRRFEAEGFTVAEQQATGRAGDRIRAIILRPPDQEDALPGVQVPRLLVYHQRSGQPPLLLFEDEGGDEKIQFAGYGQSWTTPLGWRDINGDGLLELPVWASNGGFCFACSRVYVLQLAPVDDPGSAESGRPWQIRELTGAVPYINLLQNPVIPKWLTDFNGDGIAEIEALDGSFEYAFGLWDAYSPRFYRPLIWTERGYTDVSRGSPAYFDGQIQRAAAAVQATFGEPLASQDPIGRALTVLLAYEASGRRDEGWAAFWLLSDPANWPGEGVPGLLDLLSRIRQHLQGQYERGEVFAPWPPLVPVLPAASNSDNAVQASNQITQPLPLPPPEPPSVEPTPEPPAEP